MRQPFSSINFPVASKTSKFANPEEKIAFEACSCLNYKASKEKSVEKIYSHSDSHISSLPRIISFFFFSKGMNFLDKTILFVIGREEDETSHLTMSNRSIYKRKRCIRAICYLSKQDEQKNDTVSKLKWCISRDEHVQSSSEDCIKNYSYHKAT